MNDILILLFVGFMGFLNTSTQCWSAVELDPKAAGIEQTEIAEARVSDLLRDCSAALNAIERRLDGAIENSDAKARARAAVEVLRRELKPIRRGIIPSQAGPQIKLKFERTVRIDFVPTEMVSRGALKFFYEQLNAHRWASPKLNFKLTPAIREFELLLEISKRVDNKWSGFSRTDFRTYSDEYISKYHSGTRQKVEYLNSLNPNEEYFPDPHVGIWNVDASDGVIISGRGPTETLEKSGAPSAQRLEIFTQPDRRRVIVEVDYPNETKVWLVYWDDEFLSWQSYQYPQNAPFIGKSVPPAQRYRNSGFSWPFFYSQAKDSVPPKILDSPSGKEVAFNVANLNLPPNADFFTLSDSLHAFMVISPGSPGGERAAIRYYRLRFDFDGKQTYAPELLGILEADTPFVRYRRPILAHKKDLFMLLPEDDLSTPVNNNLRQTIELYSVVNNSSSGGARSIVKLLDLVIDRELPTDQENSGVFPPKDFILTAAFDDNDNKVIVLMASGIVHVYTVVQDS